MSPKPPPGIARNLKTPEYIKLGDRCSATNWVGGDRCCNVTHWRCGECGKPTCGTHSGWHARPESKIWGTTVCRGSYSMIPPRHPARLLPSRA